MVKARVYQGWVATGVIIFQISVTGFSVAESFKTAGVEDKPKIFLKAANLAELGIAARDLESVFRELVDPLIETDSDLATELALKTGKLIRFEERNNGGWFEAPLNQQSHLTRWLVKQEESFRSIEYYRYKLALHRRDKQSMVGFDGKVSEAQRSPLLQRFTAYGGTYRPELASEFLATRLLKVCGEETKGFLIPYAASIYPHLSPYQRSGVMDWVKTIEVTDKRSDVASAFRLGFHIQAGICSAATRDELVNLLSDGEISPSWRVGFISFLEDLNFTCDRRIAEVSGKVIAEALRSEAALSGEAFYGAIKTFLQGDQESPDWRKTGEEILVQWKHRNRFLGESPRKGRNLRANHRWCVPIVDLACRLSHEKMVDWNLLNFRTAPAVAHGMIVPLVRDGYFRQAKKLLFDECVVASYQRERFLEDFGYTEEFHLSIAPFLESFDDEKQHQFAAFFLASIPDSVTPGVGRQTLPSHADRIQTVYQDEYPLRVQTDSVNARILEILSMGWGSPAIEKCLTKYQVGIDVSVNRNPLKLRPEWGVRVELFEARRSLDRGETFPWLFNWGRACFEDNQSIALERACIAAVMVEAIEEQIREARSNPVKQGMLLKVACQMLETMPPNVYRDDLYRLAVTILGAHALRDDMETFHQWWTTLDRGSRRFYRGLLVDRLGVLDQFGSRENFFEASPNRATAGREFVESIAKSEIVNNCFQGTSFLAYANYQNLIAAEDIPVVAGSIAEAAPRGGSAYREWFGSLAAEGRLDRALRIADGLLRDREGVPDSLQQVIGIEKSLILEAMGRRDEAADMIEQLKTLDRCELSGEYHPEILGWIEERLEK